MRSVRLWESTGLKLKEAALTADQIQSLFAEIEKGATAAGGNRTMLGKGKDAASAVNKAWEDLKTKIQDSGPIKGFDQKVSDALSKIGLGTADPQFNGEVNKWVQKYRDFAKKHPMAQGAIYATLIALAGISGAGVGGAAALGLLKMADKILQGERFTSAAYSGAKTGAMAYGASKIGDMVKGKPDAPADASNLAQDMKDNPMLAQRAGYSTTGDDAAFDAMDQAKELRAALRAPDGAVDAAGSAASGAGEVVKGSGQEMFKSLATDPAANSTLKALADKIASGTFTDADYDTLRGQLDTAVRMADNADVPGSLKIGSEVFTGADKARIAKAHYDLVDAMMNKAVQVKYTGVESKQLMGRALSEGQVYMIFNRVCARNDQLLSEGRLIEGPLDAIKGLAGKAAGAVAGKAKQIGANLTTKVTADKLNSAWKKAGTPTDSEELKAFLNKQGVSADVVDTVYKTLKIPAAAPAGAVDIEQVKQMIAGLPTDRKARLLKYLTKQPAAPAQTAAA
jgi:hypothetical protein